MIRSIQHLMMCFLSMLLFACNTDQGKSKPKESIDSEQQVVAVNSHWNNLSLPEVSIEYPKEWTLDTTGANETLFILISQKMDSLDQFSATLNLFSEPVGEARLSEYVVASEKAIQGFMRNSRLRKSKDTLIEGKPFHLVQFVAESDGRNLIFDQWYTIQNQTAYVLTYNCEEEEYGLMDALATKVIQSMRLK